MQVFGTILMQILNCVYIYLKLSKRILILGLFTFPLVICWAQRNQNAISNLYYHELYLMNPAAANFNKGCINAKAFQRQQWYGMEDAPTTQLLSFQATLAGNLGSGSYVYKDKNGYNSEFGLEQAFSYEVFLKKSQKTLSSLTFGLAFSVNQHTIDQSEFDNSTGDPAISGVSESGWGYNAAAGVLFKHNFFVTGFSITNLFPENNPLYQSYEEPGLPLTFNFHFGTYFRHPNRELYWEPSIMIKQTERNDNRFDINIKGSIPSITNEYLWFWGAISYRRSIDYDFGKNLALAPALGVNFKSISVGVEYQIGLTTAQQYYGSAYQIILGYRFCKRPYGGIPCSEREEITGHKYKSKR
jgi:type IX secretion system PorP/SprF family membrane protein